MAVCIWQYWGGEVGKQKGCYRTEKQRGITWKRGSKWTVIL